MSNYTDLIVYLWLVPILLLFPLALAVALVKISGQYVFLAGKITNEEKRQHSRLFSYKDTVAKITVGDTTCTGLVCNISKTGVSLKNLPEIISDEIDKLSVVISHYGIDYNLLFKTKWVKLTASGRRIGAEIDSASSDWSKFLLQTEKIARQELIVITNIAW